MGLRVVKLVHGGPLQRYVTGCIVLFEDPNPSGFSVNHEGVALNVRRNKDLKTSGACKVAGGVTAFD